MDKKIIQHYQRRILNTKPLQLLRFYIYIFYQENLHNTYFYIELTTRVNHDIGKYFMRVVGSKTQVETSLV